MLLPSALSCDAHTQSSFAATSTARSILLPPPRPASQSLATPSPNIFAACSALQSLLANTLPLSTISSRSASNTTTLDSPIHFTTTTSQHKTSTKALKQKRYPSQGHKPRTSNSKSKSKIQYTPPPAPCRKRRRDQTPDNTEEQEANNTISAPATPKRQRRCYPPPSPSFLQNQQQQQPQTPFPFHFTPQTTFITPSHPAPLLDPLALRTPPQIQCDNAGDDSEEDAALINIILHKLHLRRADWDACCVGREGGSTVGERFRMLMSLGAEEGAVVGPFRRGEGGLRRGSVKGLGFGEA